MNRRKAGILVEIKKNKKKKEDPFFSLPFIYFLLLLKKKTQKKHFGFSFFPPLLYIYIYFCMVLKINN